MSGRGMVWLSPSPIGPSYNVRGIMGNRLRPEPGELINRVARANLATFNLAKNNSSNCQNCVGPRLSVNGNN